MDCEHSICRSSQLSHEIRTLVSFSKSMMDREISGGQKVLYILNKNSIDVELQDITGDEIYGEKGVRVTHQFINFHVNSHLEPLMKSRKTKCLASCRCSLRNLRGSCLNFCE